MKIKFFMLLLALAMNAITYANTSVVGPSNCDEIQFERVVITLEVDADWARSLTEIMKNLAEEPTCTVTIKLKAGLVGTGIEGSFTITGDCDEIFEIAKQRIQDLRDMINNR
jgi:hypothetical protein